MRIQLAKETRQPPVIKNIQWPGVLVFETFPKGIMISEHVCSDSNSDIASALEIGKSGANLVPDRKVDFSQNLGCALADFEGHFSSRDLHVLNRGPIASTVRFSGPRPCTEGRPRGS